MSGQLGHFVAAHPHPLPGDLIPELSQRQGILIGPPPSSAAGSGAVNVDPAAVEGSASLGERRSVKNPDGQTTPAGTTGMADSPATAINRAVGSDSGDQLRTLGKIPPRAALDPERTCPRSRQCRLGTETRPSTRRRPRTESQAGPPRVSNSSTPNGAVKGSTAYSSRRPRTVSRNPRRRVRNSRRSRHSSSLNLMATLTSPVDAALADMALGRTQMTGLACKRHGRAHRPRARRPSRLE